MVTALSGTKPTVLPLPGVEDATSNQKCSPSVVVSVMTTDATTAALVPVPLAVERDNNELLQGSQPSEIEEATADGILSTPCSSENGHECPPAQLALSENAVEVTITEDPSATTKETEPHREGTECSIAASVVSDESTGTALPIRVQVDSQVVATAAAVAASMNTNETGSSNALHPGEERAVGATSINAHSSPTGESSDDTVQREVAAATETANVPIVTSDDANMTDQFTNVKQADVTTSLPASLCMVSGMSTAIDSTRASFDVVASVDTAKGDPDSKALSSATQSSIVTPPTSSASNKPANPTPLTIQQPLSEATLPQSQTKLDANIDVVDIEITPPGRNTSLATSANMPGELTDQQTHIMGTSSAHGDLQLQTTPFQERPAPPRFPEVPAVVGQEGSDDQNNKDAPHEVPPV